MPIFSRIAGVYRNSHAFCRCSGVYTHTYLAYARVASVWKPLWSYYWEVGGWGGCSVTCGGGTQWRSVVCKRSDGQSLADGYCTKYGQAKPAVSQSCNTHQCYTYGWAVGGFGGCSNSCGGGAQYRDVWCQRSDGARVDNGYCGGGMPGNSQGCLVCNCGFNDSAYCAAYAKYLTATRGGSWSEQSARNNIRQQGYSPGSHHDRYGASQSICGWYSPDCCLNAGRRYYA